jgi:peptidyl-tRNA hydrolase, PTH1 family
LSRLVLGLGNPGERYRDTRHNLGFRVVEELARRHRIALDRVECNSLVGELTGEPSGLVLAQPQTYMNRSGFAARCLLERREFPPENLLVVYDALGRLRLRPGGSPGCHRGIESIVESLGFSEVPRLRMGLGAEEGAPETWADFVLAPFLPEEREAVDAMILRAADACEAWWHEGIEPSMNRFNR